MNEYGRSAMGKMCKAWKGHVGKQTSRHHQNKTTVSSCTGTQVEQRKSPQSQQKLLLLLSAHCDVCALSMTEYNARTLYIPLDTLKKTLLT